MKRTSNKLKKILAWFMIFSTILSNTAIPIYATEDETSSTTAEDTKSEDEDSESESEDSESESENGETQTRDRGTKLQNALGEKLDIHENDRVIQLNTTPSAGYETMVLTDDSSIGNKLASFKNFFEARSLKEDAKIEESLGVKKQKSNNTSWYTLALDYTDYLFENGCIVRVWESTTSEDEGGKSTKWAEYNNFKTFNDTADSPDTSLWSDATQSNKGAVQLDNKRDVTTAKAGDTTELAKLVENYSNKGPDGLTGVWSIVQPGYAIKITCDKNWYDGASDEQKEFLDNIRNANANSKEGVDEEDGNGASASDAVDASAKEDDWEYTLLNSFSESEDIKNQFHWLAFNSNLIVGEFIMPMEQSVRDVLQNQNIRNGILNFEHHMCDRQDQAPNAGLYQGGHAAIDNMACANDLDGGGTETKTDGYGMLDLNGNLVPIYATPLYLDTGSGEVDNGFLRRAKVQDLFELSATNPNRKFCIKYRDYDGAASEEAGMPMYKSRKRTVYRFDYITYEYIAMATILDPKLTNLLSAYANSYVSMDMYGNIILSSDIEEIAGKVVVPAIANSYFNNKSPDVLFNRIFVAGYDFNTANTLLDKAKIDSSSTKLSVTKKDVQKAIKANIVGKNKFFMMQYDVAFQNVSEKLPVSKIVDKNAWNTFYANLLDFYTDKPLDTPKAGLHTGGSTGSSESSSDNTSDDDEESESESSSTGKKTKTIIGPEKDEQGPLAKILTDSTTDKITFSNLAGNALTLANAIKNLKTKTKTTSTTSDKSKDEASLLNQNSNFKTLSLDDPSMDIFTKTVYAEETTTDPENPEDKKMNLGELSLVTFGTTKSEKENWKYSVQVKKASTKVAEFVFPIFGKDYNNNSYNFIFGDWTKYQDRSSKTGPATPLFSSRNGGNNTESFLLQTTLNVDGTDMDIYSLNFPYFINLIDSLASDSVNADTWMKSPSETEVAAWMIVVSNFLTNTSSADEATNKLDNPVFLNYISYLSDEEKSALSDTVYAEANSGRGHFAYNINQESFYGAFIRSWDMEGFVKIDEGGMINVNDNDDSTLETNEKRSSDILYYMHSILSDLGTSLTDITAMRLSHEYRSIESSELLNLIFQIDNLLENQLILRIIQAYIFIVIVLNCLWFIFRVINLFGETEDAAVTYVASMLKSIGLSTLPLLLLLFFIYVANMATSLIFTNTFMYWTGIHLDTINLRGISEDSFSSQLENFLAISAPETYENSVAQLSYYPATAVLEEDEEGSGERHYNAEKISLTNLVTKIRRGPTNTDVSSGEFDLNDDGTLDISPAEASRMIYANGSLRSPEDLYEENIFYYFYDTMRFHYYMYYSEAKEGNIRKLNTLVSDDLNATDGKGRFMDLEYGLVGTTGSVLDMINDPIFLFGDSYLDNKEELGDFSKTSDEYLRKLQVQDVCNLTDLFSNTYALRSEAVTTGYFPMIESAPWFSVLKSSSLINDSVLSTAIGEADPLDPANYGENKPYGSVENPETILGCKALYPEGYKPSIVESRFDDINKQVVKDLLKLNDYQGFSDETILQLAALTMTIDFNRMMTSTFKPNQSLEPMSLYGKSYGMDTIFTSLYIENSSSLKSIIGQDMVLYVKNKGGFIAQILLIITLIVGQFAGLAKFILILFILLLSMFTFLFVYNFARDFYSEAWLGLVGLYIMQLAVHVLFLIVLAALCTPRIATVSTSIFQGYAGVVKLVALLILFIIQIVSFGYIGIFAARNYYTLGGDIIKAKFNDMQSAFSNLIAGNGFQATSTSAEYSADSVNMNTNSAETSTTIGDAEANADAMSTNTNDVGTARQIAETAVAGLALTNASSESASIGKAPEGIGLDVISSEETSGGLTYNASGDSALITIPETIITSTATLGALDLTSSYKDANGKQITAHTDGMDTSYNDDYWNPDNLNDNHWTQSYEEFLSNSYYMDSTKKHLQDEKYLSDVNNFLNSKGVTSIPMEVRGTDEQFAKYLSTASDRGLAEKQRAAYLMEQAGMFDKIQQDAKNMYGENAAGYYSATARQFADSFSKATNAVEDNAKAYSNFTSSIESAKELGVRKLADELREQRYDSIAYQTPDGQIHEVYGSFNSDQFSKQFQSDQKTTEGSRIIQHTSEETSKTVMRYSDEGESAFGDYQEEDLDIFEDTTTQVYEDVTSTQSTESKDSKAKKKKSKRLQNVEALKRVNQSQFNDDEE